MNEMKSDRRSEDEQLASIHYWQSRTSAERFQETLRLSIEQYGKPEGVLSDGPVAKMQRMPDGSLRILSEAHGLNPLHHS
jgi:hypothetical protein